MILSARWAGCPIGKSAFLISKALLKQLTWKLDALTVGKTGASEKAHRPTVVTDIARSVLLAPYLSIEPLSFLATIANDAPTLLLLSANPSQVLGRPLTRAVDKLYHEQNLTRRKLNDRSIIKPWIGSKQISRKGTESRFSFLCTCFVYSIVFQSNDTPGFVETGRG